MIYHPREVSGTRTPTERHLHETVEQVEDTSVLVVDLKNNKAFSISPIQVVMKFAHERNIPEVRFINADSASGRFVERFAVEFVNDIYPHIKLVIES